MPVNKSKSDQHIWPIFLIAILLGVFGFALALMSTPASLPIKSVEPLRFERPPLLDGDAPVVVTHKNLSRKYKVYIEQEGTSSPHTNRSLFSFTVVDEKKSDTLLHRTFENAAIQIYTDSKEIDAPISFDVARLIQTTKYEVNVDEKGNQSAKLISSDPGKLQSVLRMIESSLALLNTTLPSKSTDLHKRWTYLIPTKAAEFGGVRTLVGQSEEMAIIRQTINQVSVPENVDARVSGSGTSVVNKKDGSLEESTITMQSVIKLDGKNHASATTIVLNAIH